MMTKGAPRIGLRSSEWMLDGGSIEQFSKLYIDVCVCVLLLDLVDDMLKLFDGWWTNYFVYICLTSLK
jgi:hypothetical protein